MELEQKIELFISELKQKIEENLPKIGYQFLNHYDWPEFDPLREEITRCLLCDYCQAAITLTNHLLENFLKTMLIYKDESEIDITKDMRTAFKAGIEKYNHLHLNETIGKAKKFNLISKEEGKTLNKFRDDFRNAYSHANKKKIFKDMKIPTQRVSLNKNLKYDVGEQRTSDLSELLFAQGISQAIISKTSAFHYFINVDHIIRNTLEKFSKDSSSTDNLQIPK